MLKLDALTVGYQGRAVLKPISLLMDRGESLLVIGSNGAGKSTLLRTLVGLVPPVSGAVEILGSVVKAGGLQSLVQRGVRFLGQGNRAFGDLTTREHASVMLRLYGAQTRADSVLPASHGDQRVDALSIGQRRVEALRLLDTEKSELFVLDEPRAGLDKKISEHVTNWVKQRLQSGVSIVMVEHEYHDIIEFFSKVIVLWDGRVNYVTGPVSREAVRDILRQMISEPL
jgi:ABC-type multidrug transport system ATPase subunit